MNINNNNQNLNEQDQTFMMNPQGNEVEIDLGSVAAADQQIRLCKTLGI
jgi:hypothetical protein